MQVFDRDCLSPSVIESVHSLRGEQTQRGEVKHQSHDEYGDSSHPTADVEKALAVIDRTEIEKRVVVFDINEDFAECFDLSVCVCVCV